MLFMRVDVQSQGIPIIELFYSFKYEKRYTIHKGKLKLIGTTFCRIIDEERRVTIKSTTTNYVTDTFIKAIGRKIAFEKAATEYVEVAFPNSSTEDKRKILTQILYTFEDIHTKKIRKPFRCPDKESQLRKKLINQIDEVVACLKENIQNYEGNIPYVNIMNKLVSLSVSYID